MGMRDQEKEKVMEKVRPVTSPQECLLYSLSRPSCSYSNLSRLRTHILCLLLHTLLEAVSGPPSHLIMSNELETHSLSLQNDSYIEMASVRNGKIIGYDAGGIHNYTV